MNIEQLEYIVSIANTGSISASSDYMHVSQAGISKAITKLEKEFGFKLFKRSRSGTVPTERGQIIIEKADEILMKIQEIKEEVKTQSELIQGEVRLSVSPNFMAILPKSIVSFKNDYPRVRLEIMEKDSEFIIDDILQGRTDMGLIYFNPNQSELTHELAMTTLIESRIVVCVSKHSLLASKTSITPEELLGQPFVAINGSFSNRYMREFMRKYGPVDVIFTSNNQEVLKRAIAEGAGIGLFIEFSIKNDPHLLSSEIVAIPLVSDDQNVVSLGCARLKTSAFPTAQRELLNYFVRETSALA